MTPTDPNQDEINEIIGLTERKIRDLMNLLVLIVFNKIIDKTSEQFETFFPCHRKSLKTLNFFVLKIKAVQSGQKGNNEG